jgi:hypothetical protein
MDDYEQCVDFEGVLGGDLLNAIQEHLPIIGLLRVVAEIRHRVKVEIE